MCKFETRKSVFNNIYNFSLQKIFICLCVILYKCSVKYTNTSNHILVDRY